MSHGQNDRTASAVTTLGGSRFPPTRVVKLGGSLLSCAGIVEVFCNWLDQQTSAATIVVVGGGRLADAVRTIDRKFELTAQSAHDQAIRAMQLNAFVLCQCWGDSHWLPELQDWEPMVRSSGDNAGQLTALIDPVRFMQVDEPQLAERHLPIGWKVTSDSIAARIAQIAGATELVLLKSTLPAHSTSAVSMSDAAKVGFVDGHFPIAAAGLPYVCAVNLLEPAQPKIMLS